MPGGSQTRPVLEKPALVTIVKQKATVREDSTPGLWVGSHVGAQIVVEWFPWSAHPEVGRVERLLLLVDELSHPKESMATSEPLTPHCTPYLLSHGTIDLDIRTLSSVCHYEVLLDVFIMQWPL